MSYQALYRVWRPQRFDDLVGQQIVTRTLKKRHYHSPDKPCILVRWSTWYW